MTTGLLPRGSRFGGLRLTGFIGSGGFSDVYEAFDEKGRRLAVKVLRLTGLNAESQTDRIIREREILARVDSRGVAKLVSADLSADTPWIASEFVDGPTLRESVRTDGPLSAVETLSLVRRLAEILGELHSSGIAHRDLTPNNIVLGPDGPVIIDFGSARLDLENSATGSLLLAGTQGYTAPEALRNEPAGRAADMFSLGRVAQFCVSGEDDGEPDFEPSIAALCADNPGDRPSANDIVELLPAFDSLPERHRKRDVEKLPRRFRLSTVVALATAAALIAVLGGFFAFRPSPVTTADLLGVEGIEFGVPSDGEGLLVLHPGGEWNSTRQRPQDSIFAKTQGIIESSVTYRIDASASVENGYEAFHSQLLLRDLRSSDAAPDNSEVPADVAARFDAVTDVIESDLLSTGCTMTRAEKPLKLPDGPLLLGASSKNCFGSEDETVAAGVLWRNGSAVAVEWAGALRTDTSLDELLGSLSIDWDFTAPHVDGSTRLLELVNLTEAKIDTANQQGPLDTYLEYANIAVLVEPGSAIEVKNSFGIDAQISAKFLIPSGERGEWLPAGRWWTRGEGEVRSFANPFDVPAIVSLEVEGLWDAEPIDMTISLDDSAPAVFSLFDVLDDVLPSTSKLGGTHRNFALPSNPPESSDSATDNAVFNLNGVEIGIETALLGGSIGTADLTFVLRADDSWSDYELSYSEAHNPHWLLAFGPAHEYLAAMETSDWVTVGESTKCLSETIWSFTEGDLVVNVRAALDCEIQDVYRYQDVSIDQTNPVFYFSFGSEDSVDDWISGSFAPESGKELDRFKAFLADVISRGDEIAAARGWE